ncbi:hypothetical protein HAX54_043621, partial [Datura stramonium]|nr:hypothetical protein [Datura stramonium]
MAAMREVLRGFPRPSQDGALSSVIATNIEALQDTVASLDQAYVEIQADLEAKKRKLWSQDKLFMQILKG